MRRATLRRGAGPAAEAAAPVVPGAPGARRRGAAAASGSAAKLQAMAHREVRPCQGESLSDFNFKLSWQNLEDIPVSNSPRCLFPLHSRVSGAQTVKQNQLKHIPRSLQQKCHYGLFDDKEIG